MRTSDPNREWHEPMVVYAEAQDEETWWCNSHQRRATHMYFHAGHNGVFHCCDPKLGGIMLPCRSVNLTGEVELEDAS